MSTFLFLATLLFHSYSFTFLTRFISVIVQRMLGRLRRITVYETAGRFYLVGCDASGTRFKVLKIDRIDSKALLTGEPGCDYSKEEILELLATITEGSSGEDAILL
ncbi:unnamed protein product [Strongylus vulgaris]|uniref:Uncharacterized protein n=1 Tax=Strongylus vulgaris TaxID=40348 RepID=A0A3P7L3Z4_STRVU|nr:unnamed protein product [Strongylus vulgaris]